MLCVLFLPLEGGACSVCKVTINGRTYFGSNEDNWRRDSKIWFERGVPGKLGAVYVGFGDLPQGGMNTAGLAFDALATLPKPVRTVSAGKKIGHPRDFLKEILQTCKTVEDVRRVAAGYNRQEIYKHGVLLFADTSGAYLVLESDTLISGKEEKYILANFCPSITGEEEKLRFDRYRRGKAFLALHEQDTGSRFAYALIDTMHECREKIGDGTMYSFVADLHQGDFTLYFYHDFRRPITFNLHRELAKGDRWLSMPQLFPGNKEYRKFLDFKTPRNSPPMLLFLFAGGGLFAFSCLFFAVSGLRKGEGPAAGKKLMLAGLSFVLAYYITVLYRHEAVFYAPAPFQDYRFSMLNVAAYIPFLLLLVLLPLIRLNLNILPGASWGPFSKSLLTLNVLFYAAFVILFLYWGMYRVF